MQLHRVKLNEEIPTPGKPRKRRQERNLQNAFLQTVSVARVKATTQEKQQKQSAQPPRVPTRTQDDTITNEKSIANGRKEKKIPTSGIPREAKRQHK